MGEVTSRGSSRKGQDLTTPRALNALVNAIIAGDDPRTMTEEDWLRKPNCGKKTAELLASHFGMDRESLRLTTASELQYTGG